MKFLSLMTRGSNIITDSLNRLKPAFMLGIRIWMFKNFFWSGWLKLKSWQSTLYLFEYEFKVPLLSPVLAAYTATAAEIILPILILLGLGARLPAIASFMFSIVMIVSYPILMAPEGACMVKGHILCLVLASLIIFYGHGKWSIDRLIQKNICPEYRY